MTTFAGQFVVEMKEGVFMKNSQKRNKNEKSERPGRTAGVGAFRVPPTKKKSVENFRE